MNAEAVLPLGVTGNTPDSGSGESWFEPRRGNFKRRLTVVAFVFLLPLVTCLRRAVDPRRGNFKRRLTAVAFVSYRSYLTKDPHGSLTSAGEPFGVLSSKRDSFTSLELPPTKTRKNPGSTTRRICAS